MAQSQERRMKIKETSRTTSSRCSLFALLLCVTRCTKNRMTWLGFGLKAFGQSWRFSARLQRSCWGSQPPHKGWHGASYLRPGQDRTTGFPRSVATPHQGTSQHQLMMGTGHTCVQRSVRSAVAHPRAAPVCRSEERNREVGLISLKGVGGSPFQTHQRIAGSRVFLLAL